MKTAIAIVALSTVIVAPALAQQGCRQARAPAQTLGYEVYVNGKFAEMWACTRPSGVSQTGSNTFDVCEFRVEARAVEPPADSILPAE